MNSGNQVKSIFMLTLHFRLCFKGFSLKVSLIVFLRVEMSLLCFRPENVCGQFRMGNIKGYFNPSPSEPRKILIRIYLAFAADTKTTVFIEIIASCPVIHETKCVFGKLTNAHLGDTR